MILGLTGCDTTPLLLFGNVAGASSGIGVGGVTVGLYADDDPVLLAQTSTDVSGGYGFRASAVSDGSYRLRIGERWWPEAASWAEADTLVLSASAASTIDVVLDEIGALAGAVVDPQGDGVASVAVVALRESDGQAVGMVDTAGDGSFRLPVIEGGAFNMVLVGPGPVAVFVGGDVPTTTIVESGDVSVGEIDHSTGLPYTPASSSTSRVSITSGGGDGDGTSTRPSISGDGRFVAFQSEASNLVGGDANGEEDVFVHDRSTGVTSRVSVASDGAEADWGAVSPSVSGDGRFVAFESNASNLVDGDANEWGDVFVHDRSTGLTTRVGKNANPFSDGPTISADGQHVAFLDYQPGRTDVLVHDRSTGVTSVASAAVGGGPANGVAGFVSISADGRHVAYLSLASNLVPGDTNDNADVFVHDVVTGLTVRASVRSDGTETLGYSDMPSLSADGQIVAFESSAVDLVPHDSNARDDVFVRELAAH